MSKTDKTRPWNLRKQDHRVERPRLENDDKILDYKTYKFWVGEMIACCRSCSKNNQQARKEKNRKQRQAGKKEARQYESTAD